MHRKPLGLVFLMAIAAKPGRDQNDLVRLQSQLGEAKTTRRYEPRSLLGCCWASWFRLRPRCYSRQRIVDTSTHKQNLVNLLFPSLSFAGASSIDRDSIRTTQHLVSAFILSRVNYCNAVLAGLPTSTLAPLQRVINAAARFVAGATPCTHVSGIMKSLHWLPIAYRIRFKLCAYTRHSQRNQSFVSNGYNNTDLVFARTSSASFSNTTSLASGQNLETDLSLFLDRASGMLFPPI